ncbi:MAG: hypothetical protein WEB00_16150 [Dehalococcoidia bacterium]
MRKADWRLVLLSALAVGIFAPALAYLALRGDADPVPDSDLASNTPLETVQQEDRTQGEERSLEVGDFVEITSPGGCAVLEALPQRETLYPRSSPCAGNGATFVVTRGPRREGERRFWSLSGLGWVDEQVLKRLDSDPRERLRAQQLISFVDENKDLYTIHVDGSDRRLVAEGPVGGYSWSPDGRRIAYGTHAAGNVLRAERMVIVALDGDVEVEVDDVSGYSDFAWSPDGTMIVVSPSDERGYDRNTFVLSTETGERLLELPETSYVSWSADSRRLGLLQYDTTQEPGLDYPSVAIYVDLATGRAADLIEGGANYRDLLLGLPLFRPGRPDEIAYAGGVINLITGDSLPLPGAVVRWSPDGRFAVLALQGPDHFAGHHYLLWELDARSAGRRSRMYISLPSCQCDGGTTFFAAEMLFSPDGRYFLSRNSDAGAEGSQIVALRQGEDWPRIPHFGAPHQFSADGRYLLVGSGDDEDKWIMVMPVQQGRVIALQKGYLPAWQPAASP